MSDVVLVALIVATAPTIASLAAWRQAKAELAAVKAELVVANKQIAALLKELAGV